MKIKVRPEDFIVRERPNLAIKQEPDEYRIYELRQQQWDSSDLLDLLARRLRVGREDLRVGGRKDRHGVSEQLLSVRNRHGLPDTLADSTFSLVHHGYSSGKMTAAAIAGNSFHLTLRDMADKDVALLKKNCQAVRTWGFPNYFDEQRFGSARAGKGFLGKALFLGRMEEALKIFLAPSGHEPAGERLWKTQAASLWRQWRKIEAPTPPRFRRVMDVLLAPGHYMAFNQAVNAIDRDLIILSLHAYQSFLFNRLAVRYLEELEKTGELGPLAVCPFPFGDLVFYRSLTETEVERLTAVELPVPGHDTLTEDPRVQAVLAAVLTDEKITLDDLKVKKLPGKAVRGASRPLIILPEEFAFDGPFDDDLYAGRKKLILDFYLPRGGYATMLVKRICLGT